MGLMTFTKTLLLMATIVSSATALSAEKVKTDYRALRVEDKVIATNGKFSYVIDPSGLQEFIDKAGFAQVKIYGTEIWLTLKKDGDIAIRKTHLKNSSYYVLAPLKNLNAPADAKINYKTFAMGYSTSNALRYPENFCTSCAAPTSLDNKSKSVVRVFSNAATKTPDAT